MSTQFALIRKEVIERDSITQDHDFIQIENDTDFTYCAYRSNSGVIVWEYPFDLISQYLPEDTKVYAMDNAAQGIYTIGDLKREKQNG